MAHDRRPTARPGSTRWSVRCWSIPRSFSHACRRECAAVVAAPSAHSRGTSSHHRRDLARARWLDRGRRTYSAQACGSSRVQWPASDSAGAPGRLVGAGIGGAAGAANGGALGMWLGPLGWWWGAAAGAAAGAAVGATMVATTGAIHGARWAADAGRRTSEDQLRGSSAPTMKSS